MMGRDAVESVWAGGRRRETSNKNLLLVNTQTQNMRWWIWLCANWSHMKEMGFISTHF